MRSGLIGICDCLWILTSVLPAREGRGGTFLIVHLAFRQIGEEQIVFLVSASSQLPSAQNNQYENMAYFGVHALLLFKLFQNLGNLIIQSSNLLWIQ